MSDDKTKRGPQDTGKINIHEKYEVDYWTRRFGVTPEKLKKAVKIAGTSADAVERELKTTT